MKNLLTILLLLLLPFASLAQTWVRDFDMEPPAFFSPSTVYNEDGIAVTMESASNSQSGATWGLDTAQFDTGTQSIRVRMPGTPSAVEDADAFARREFLFGRVDYDTIGWFRFRMRVHEEHENVPWFQTIFSQFKNPSRYGFHAALAFKPSSDRAGTITMQYRYMENNTSSSAEPGTTGSPYIDTAQTFVRGQWYDFVIEAKLNVAGQGFYRVWVDGVQRVNIENKNLGWSGITYANIRVGIYGRVENYVRRINIDNFRQNVSLAAIGGAWTGSPDPDPDPEGPEADPSGANVHYVDPDAVGANNGTSWTDAWNSVAAIEADWSGVQPGDYILLSGGPEGGSKSYVDWIDLDLTGSKATSATNRIIIQPSNDTNHSGAVIWSTTSGTNGGGSPLIDITTSWLRLDGKDRWWLTDYYNPYDRDDGTGIRLQSEVTGTEIVGLVFSNLNNGVMGNNLSGDYPGMVRSNRLYQTRGNAAIRMFNGGTKYVLDNYIESAKNSTKPPGGEGFNSYGGPDMVQINGNSVVSNNVFNPTRSDKYGDTNVITSTQHQDAIEGTGSDHLWVANHFLNSGGSGPQSSTSLGSTATQLENVIVANNVFEMTGPSLSSNPEVFRVFNPNANLVSLSNYWFIANTVVDSRGGSPVLRFNSSNTGGLPISATNSGIVGNLFINSGGGSFGGNSAIINMSSLMRAGFTISHNGYWHENPSVAYIQIGGTKTLISDWIATEEPTGTWGLPQFVVPYVALSDQNDFRLASNDTLALDTGTDLSALITYDKDGNTRPQDGGWDRGAYEFSEGEVLPPSGPVILSAVAENANRIDLSWADTSNNETKYRVEMSTTSGSGFALKGETAANVTTFSAVGLADGTTYFFRVRPENSAGVGDWSNEATATTLTIEPGSGSQDREKKRQGYKLRFP